MSGAAPAAPTGGEAKDAETAKAEPAKKEAREKKPEGGHKKEGHKKEAQSHPFLAEAPKKVGAGIKWIAGWVKKKVFQTLGLGFQGVGMVAGPPLDVAKGLGRTVKDTTVNQWNRGKNFLKLTGKLTGISWIMDGVRKSIHEATGGIAGGKNGGPGKGAAPTPAH